MSLTDPVPEMQAFSCPRCAQATEEAWYGPCQQCRGQLRTAMTGQARTIETEAYEPKMNVTPNAVATKD